MVEINWTEQSLVDIDNIAEFIAKDSLKYAQIQVQHFFDSVEHLQSQPKAGRIVPETNDTNIREIIVGFYRVIYLITSDKQIDIITIHHSKRLLNSRLK